MRNTRKTLWLVFSLLLACVLSAPLMAQESRGTLLGTITDAQKAVVPGVEITVTNVATNASRTTVTNDTGYYEIPFLDAGDYTISAELPGFRKYHRTGVTVNVATKVTIDIQLEVGELQQVIEVNAAAPLLETTTASAGRVIDTTQITKLPFSDLNPFALSGMAAGMQWTGQPEYRRPFDNGGTSAFNTGGGVGQNEYTIDGAPVTGTSRRVGFVPPADAIQEFTLQTATFDASVGHTSGAVVNVMSRSGTNAYHGNIYEQHWQQRWNATPHFTRLAWERDVAQGKKTKDSEKQGTGRSNQFGATLGGPVKIPKLYDGTDKFFFFFSYNGIYQSKAETTDSINRSVPKMNWRQGDFSDLLAIDPAKYQVYDPRTAKLAGGRVVRDPFPGNKGVPILNPLYKYYEKLYPVPNDVPGLVSPEGANNYLAVAMPKNERFNSILNRFDYRFSDRQQLSAKWYWNHRLADEYDWTYETMRGLHANGLTRINKGGSGDYTWTLNNTNVLQIGLSWTRFNEGNQNNVQTGVKPSQTGLPSYIDEQTARLVPSGTSLIPRLDFDSIEDVAGDYPAIGTRGTTGEAKVTMSSILGSHSLKYGWQERRYWRASAGPGLAGGAFTFRRDFMRKNDADTVASHRGLEWASFMMGLPTGINIAGNDTGYWSTRYRAFYLHDDWRVNPRLSLNMGLRYEREGGITERFNRGLSVEFIPDAKLPITDLVQAPYATVYQANPTAGLLPPDQFKVLGGIPYLSDEKPGATEGTHHLLPRLGLVYRLDNKTVLRVGYGWYYDTLNVNNVTPSQYGYSKGTGTTLTTDNGLSFCCGVGAAANLSATKNPLIDPFPPRADNSRFDTPLGNYLGLMSRVGTDYDQDYYYPYDPAHQQRWRFGIQRQLTAANAGPLSFLGDMVIDVSYNGAYSRIPISQRINYLPAQYWATGNARKQAVDDDLNKNLTNPFNIKNLTSLQQSDPMLYSHLTTVSFFTSGTIRKHQLLRMSPHLSGTFRNLRPGVDPDEVRGVNQYHDVQIQLEKRVAHGISASFGYTHTFNNKERDWYANEFDVEPSWRLQNDTRPNRWVWITTLEMPFGRGKKWAQEGLVEKLAGGWELNWIFQLQDGPPTEWANRFFYGDLNQLEQIADHENTYKSDIHQWFNPNIVYKGTDPTPPASFVGFEGRSAQQPGSFHVRVFPSRLDSIRQDGINNWDINVRRRFRITEGVSTVFWVDLLNAFNKTNFTAPNTDPTSTNFGKVTAQRGLSRVIQFNLRLTF